MNRKSRLICVGVFAIMSSQVFSMDNDINKENNEAIQGKGHKRFFNAVDFFRDNQDAKKACPLWRDPVAVETDWIQIDKAIPQKDDLVCLRAKDRYADVCPYEHNRFVFTANDQKYINASVIELPDCPQGFIQCQAPLPSCFGDHWEMIWESNAAISLILTKFMEGNRVKAHCYWPHEFGIVETFNSDDPIEVELTGMNVSISTDIEVLEFEFVMRKGAESKTHKILHYTSWPDGGVVSPKTMRALIDYASQENSDVKKPIIVHCSAGIGRAGTFVALFSLRKAFEQGKVLNPKDQVLALRKQRAYSVQTREQYKLIINSLLD